MRKRAVLTGWLLAGLLLWAATIGLIGIVWTAVWAAAHELPWWEFALVGTGITIAYRVTGDRSRKVRHAQARQRVWLLPVRIHEDDQEGDGQ